LGNFPIALWTSIPAPSKSFLSVLYFLFGLILVDNLSKAFVAISWIYGVAFSIP